MSDYLQPQDLIDDKKHSTFFAEVITGKAGGVAGGATIDTATNAVTSQAQKTMPKIMVDAESAFDAQLSGQQSEFDSQLQAQGWNPVAGSFETGGTIVNRRDILWWEAAKAWYSWQGSLPKVVTAGSTPATSGGVSPATWVDRTDGTLRSELAINSTLNAGMYGLKSSNTSAQNTAVMNTVNALSASTGKPVYFPPLGVCKVGRMTDITGSLKWVTDGGCTIQADGDNWPWAGTNLPLLRINGSFSVEGELTIDQNWIQDEGRGYPGSYSDGKNPRTWGGYWMFEVHGDSTSSMEFEQVEWKNIYRGALAINIDRITGGFGKTVMQHCSGNSRPAVSQTILATEDPMLFHVTDNPKIECMKWNEGAVYVSNGSSVVFPWGGENVSITDSNFHGYQLVCRGPKSLQWEPSKSYSVGDEYASPAQNSYVVLSNYVSGAAFGNTEVDGVNVQKIWSPQKSITLKNLLIQSPIGDTAIYGWQNANIEANKIYDSGDMGIATSGTGALVMTGNIVERVRNGAFDFTGWGAGSVINVSNNIAVDWARASDGVFSRIDTLNPGIWASGAGFALAAYTMALLVGTGTKQVNITGNNAYLINLPPVSDSNGQVRSKVHGYYSQVSTNEAAYNTVNFAGNFCQDLEVAIPTMFINIPTHKFYAVTVTGTPQAGETFTAFNGGVRFVLCAAIGSGSRVFVRKFKGAAQPASGMLFIGNRSGATITAAASPQWDLLGSSECSNVDYTSKYIGSLPDEPLVGFATINPTSIPVGGVIGITIPVSGSQAGDYALVAPPYQIQGMGISWYVIGPDVQVILRNDMAAPIDLPEGVWKAKVIKG